MYPYRQVIRCCYLGMISQAVIINLAPVLFIPLRTQFGLSFEQVGRLVLANFVTQVTFDLVCGPLIDRLGAKPFVVAAHVLAGLGLWLFALLPGWLPNPYVGLMIGTIVCAMGGGILELVLSPIINAVPSERKAHDMSMLHSFYAWGLVVTVALSGLALWLLGPTRWPVVALAWSLLPLVNAVGFARARFPALMQGPTRQRLRELVRLPAFRAAALAIGLGGATEVAVSQWISAFAEKGLGLSKVVGDLFGLGLFGVGLGAGRVWFGLHEGRVDLTRYLVTGAALSTLAYLVASVAPWPAVSLAACALAGLTVSLLWPGVLSVAAARFPLAGASMFAALSAAGDFGAAVAPWLVGAVADRAAAGNWFTLLPGGGRNPDQLGLRGGLFMATLVPAAALWAMFRLRRLTRGAGQPDVQPPTGV